jgi:CBS domain containing-hemolysin-like protein
MGNVVLLLLAVLALVAANAFFVASEFAIVKIRSTRLQELTSEGNRRARMALSITQHLDAYLSANQLGITLASLALGWVGEEAFARLLLPLLGALGGAAAAASHTIAATLGFITITFLHTVLGELAPKSLAIQRTEPVVLWTATPLRVFYVIAFPIIWILNKASALVLRAFGLRPASETELLHSPGELRLLLPHVQIDAGARRLMDRVFDYEHRVARHVMTLRRDVIGLETGRSFAENVRFMLDNQFTRYPLIDRATGRVIGFVHIKDVMAALAAGRTPRLVDLAREPIYTTEETRLETLRREFQRRRVHIAIVRSRSGEFLGIVTLEDLLEEVVGEILDEQDVGEIPPIVQGPGGRFEVDGRLTWDIAARELGLAIPDDLPAGVETLGGYVGARLGTVPRPGDAVVMDCKRLIVVEVRDRRIRRLRGEPLENP